MEQWARYALLGTMLAAPIVLYLGHRWWRRRRPSWTDEELRAAFEAVRAGRPMTRDLARPYGVHVAKNSRRATGVVLATLDGDRCQVRLPDGTMVTATRSHRLWRRRIKVTPGDQVRLLFTPETGLGLIRAVR